MNGTDYIALVGLSTKEGPNTYTRAAEPGETCERVRPSSLPHLVAHNPPQIFPAAEFHRLPVRLRNDLLEHARLNLALPDELVEEITDALKVEVPAPVEGPDTSEDAMLLEDETAPAAGMAEETPAVDRVERRRRRLHRE